MKTNKNLIREFKTNFQNKPTRKLIKEQSSPQSYLAQNCGDPAAWNYNPAWVYNPPASNHDAPSQAWPGTSYYPAGVGLWPANGVTYPYGEVPWSQADCMYSNIPQIRQEAQQCDHTTNGTPVPNAGACKLLDYVVFKTPGQYEGPNTNPSMLSPFQVGECFHWDTGLVIQEGFNDHMFKEGFGILDEQASHHKIECIRSIQPGQAWYHQWQPQATCNTTFGPCDPVVDPNEWICDPGVLDPTIPVLDPLGYYIGSCLEVQPGSTWYGNPPPTFPPNYPDYATCAAMCNVANPGEVSYGCLDDGSGTVTISGIPYSVPAGTPGMPATNYDSNSDGCEPLMFPGTADPLDFTCCTYWDPNIAKRGCLDMSATNYCPPPTQCNADCAIPANPAIFCIAQQNCDFSCCTYENIIDGCTDTDASNYNASATADCNGDIQGIDPYTGANTNNIWIPVTTSASSNYANDVSCCIYQVQDPGGLEPADPTSPPCDICCLDSNAQIMMNPIINPNYNPAQMGSEYCICPSPSIEVPCEDLPPDDDDDFSALQIPSQGEIPPVPQTKDTPEPDSEDLPPALMERMKKLANIRRK